MSRELHASRAGNHLLARTLPCVRHSVSSPRQLETSQPEMGFSPVDSDHSYYHRIYIYIYAVTTALYTMYLYSGNDRYIQNAVQTYIAIWQRLSCFIGSK